MNGTKIIILAESLLIVILIIFGLYQRMEAEKQRDRALEQQWLAEDFRDMVEEMKERVLEKSIEAEEYRMLADEFRSRLRDCEAR